MSADERAGHRLLAEVEGHLRAAFTRVFPSRFDYRRLAEEFLSLERAGEQVDLVRSFLPFETRGRRLLEIGSGYGAFLCAAESKAGIRAYGVEPAPQEFFGTIEGCRQLLRQAGAPVHVASGVGERLPYRSGSFDVVASYNVLEHVQDPGRVIAETARVLAPGGRAVLVIPNYGSWWEGHYGLLWFPYLPRVLARLYVRLFGRDPSFIDTLQLLNVPWLQRLVAPHRRQVRVVSWGVEVWERRLATAEFGEWAHLGTLKRLVRAIHAFGLHRLVARVGAFLRWQTPIILVLERIPT